MFDYVLINLQDHKLAISRNLSNVIKSKLLQIQFLHKLSALWDKIRCHHATNWLEGGRLQPLSYKRMSTI